MAEGDLEQIQTAYEAFGRGDIPAVLDVLADDIGWSVPEVLPQGGRVSGKDGVTDFFQRLGSLWDDLNLEIEDFVASGDRVCVVGRATGKHGGEETGYGFVHAWTMRDGKAARFDEYADPPRELWQG